MHEKPPENSLSQNPPASPAEGPCIGLRRRTNFPPAACARRDGAAVLVQSDGGGAAVLDGADEAHLVALRHVEGVSWF
jgi:hypothetical protein